jgi:hypothetical protein
MCISESLSFRGERSAVEESREPVNNVGNDKTGLTLQRFQRGQAIGHFLHLWHTNLEPFPIDERSSRVPK